MGQHVRRQAFGTVIAIAFSFAAGGGQALTVEFDYTADTSGWFGANPQAKALLETAGAYYSDLFLDSFNAFSFTTDVQVGSTTLFGQTINSAADTVTVFVGAESIGGSTLGVGGPALFGPLTNIRGEIGNNFANATDFVPSWATIHFDTDMDTNWFFDTTLTTSDDIGFGQNDFYSVALHELGHALGFGTAPSFDRLTTGGFFEGPNVTALAAGGVQLDPSGGHFIDNIDQFGDPAPGIYSSIGGGSLFSTLPGAGLFEAAMDPSLTQGTRKELTDIDIAAFADIGWEINQEFVSPTPEVVDVPVAPGWLLGSATLWILGVGAARQSCRQTRR